MARQRSNTSYEHLTVSNGTSAAWRVAVWMASLRAAFSSSVPLGKPKAAMISLKASVSSSMRCMSLFMSFWPSSAFTLNSCQRSSHPRLCAERLATIAPRAAPSAPMVAAMVPPPGAGLSREVSSTNSFTVRSAKRFTGVASSNRYSMTFSRGLKGFRSSRLIDLMAILIMSSSGIPTERSCFSRK